MVELTTPVIRGIPVDADDVVRQKATEAGPSVSWGDWARQIGAGGVEGGADSAALAQHVSGGAVGGDTREYLNQLAREIDEASSPTARRAVGAKFFPDEGEESVFDVGLGRALAAKGLRSSASFLASVLPAGLTGWALATAGAPVAVAAGAAGVMARGTEAALDTGGLINQVYKAIESRPEADLMESPQYRAYREMADEKTARQQYMDDVLGALPGVMAATSAAFGGLGVERQVGRWAAGELGKELQHGLVKGVLKHGAKEGVQEIGQSGGQELLAQVALSVAGLDDFKWREVLNAATEGAAVGGMFGGVTGGAGGVAARLKARAEKRVTEEGLFEPRRREEPKLPEAKKDVAGGGTVVETVPEVGGDQLASQVLATKAETAVPSPNTVGPDAVGPSTVNTPTRVDPTEDVEEAAPVAQAATPVVSAPPPVQEQAPVTTQQIAPTPVTEPGLDTAPVSAGKPTKPAKPPRAPKPSAVDQHYEAVKALVLEKRRPSAAFVSNNIESVNLRTANLILNRMEKEGLVTAQDPNNGHKRSMVGETPTSAVIPVAPPKPRVLQSLTPESKANIAATTAKANEVAAEAKKEEQRAKRQAKRETQKIVEGDKVYSQEELEQLKHLHKSKPEERETEATRIQAGKGAFDNFKPRKQEDGWDSKERGVMQVARAAIAQRARAVVELAKKFGTSAPVLRGKNIHAGVAFLRIAQELNAKVESKKAVKEDFARFVRHELMLRNGDIEGFLADRREGGDAARRVAQSSETKKLTKIDADAVAGEAAQEEADRVDIEEATAEKTGEVKAGSEEDDRGGSTQETEYAAAPDETSDSEEGIEHEASVNKKLADDLDAEAKRKLELRRKESEELRKQAPATTAPTREVKVEKAGSLKGLGPKVAGKVSLGPKGVKAVETAKAKEAPKRAISAKTFEAKWDGVDRDITERAVSRGIGSWIRKWREPKVDRRSPLPFPEIDPRSMPYSELRQRAIIIGDNGKFYDVGDISGGHLQAVFDLAAQEGIVLSGESRNGEPVLTGNEQLYYADYMARRGLVNVTMYGDAVGVNAIEGSLSSAQVRAINKLAREVSPDGDVWVTIENTKGLELYYENDLRVLPRHIRADENRDITERARSETSTQTQPAEVGSKEWLEQHALSTLPIHERGEEYKGLLTHIATALNGPRAVHRVLVPKVVDRLLHLVDQGVMTYILSDEDFHKLRENPNDEAFFAGRDGGIIVYKMSALQKSPERTALIFAHELVHAAMMNAVWNDSPVRADLHALAQAAWDALDNRARREYGFANIDEFLAEGLANPEFQALLASVPMTVELRRRLRSNGWLISDSIKNLWEGFVHAVLKAFKLNGNYYTVMDGLLSVAARLDEGAQVFGSTINKTTIRNILAERASGAPGTLWEQFGGRPELQKVKSPAFHPRALDLTERASSTPASIRTEELLNRARDVQTTVPGRVKSFLMKVTSLDQLRQMNRGVFVDSDGDALEALVAAVQKHVPYANAIREKADKIAQKFHDWAEQNPELARRFADLGVAATMLNVNLGPNADNKHLGKDAWWGWQAKKALAELQREFNALGPEAQALWSEMSSYYRSEQNARTTKLVSNILDTLEIPLTPQERSTITSQVMAGRLDNASKALINNELIVRALERARELRVIEGVYFPLMRHGDYVVKTRDTITNTMGGVEVEPGVYEFRDKTKAGARNKARKFAETLYERDDILAVDFHNAPEEVSSTDYGARVHAQLEGVHFFDSAAEGAEFIRLNKENYSRISAEPMQRRTTGYETGDLTGSQLAAILAAVKARFPGDKAKIETFQQVLGQAAAQLMAGNRIQQRSITRRNVQGASTDFARNTLQYGEASSRYAAKLEYGPQVRKAWKRILDIDKNDDYAPNRAARAALINELDQRINDIDDPAKPSKLVQDVLSVSYLHYLFSPAWNIINSMQPSLVTFPVLAGEFGGTSAGSEIARAYSLVGGLDVLTSGVKNTADAVRNWRKASADPRDILKDVRQRVGRAPDGAELQAMLDHVIERGAISPDSVFMIDQAISQGRGAWGKFLSRLDRVSRQLPFAVETNNRAVTAVAAYRLARGRGMSAQEATSYAFDTIQNTQGDYSAANAPRVFNHPVWRVALQFKKYAQMMYALIGRIGYEALKGATPEERAAARKQFAWLCGVQIMVAGAMGLPGIELVKLAAMAAAVMGLGGGYDDWEREIRKAMAAMVGSKAAELALRGVLTRAVNIDLSSRVGMDNLLTFGEPKKYERESALAYLATTAAGAPGSMIFDAFSAASMFANGDILKGMGKVPLPKIVNDLAKAADRAANGRTSERTGKRTAEPIGYGEAAINAAGFRTGRQAEEFEEGGAKFAKRTEKDGTKREATKLKNAFAEARNEGERVKVLARLKELNKKLPEDERLTPADLKKFAKGYEQDRSKGLVEGGYRVRNKAEMEELRQAASPYNSR